MSNNVICPATGERLRLDLNAPEPPTLETAIRAKRITTNTTQAQWESLSPGMRREICRGI
jgi:hypothetical protein